MHVYMMGRLLYVLCNLCSNCSILLLERICIGISLLSNPIDLSIKYLKWNEMLKIKTYSVLHDLFLNYPLKKTHTTVNQTIPKRKKKKGNFFFTKKRGDPIPEYLWHKHMYINSRIIQTNQKRFFPFFFFF